MLTDKELAAVPEELLEDLLRYSEYGWRERRIATLLARRYPVALTEADVRKLRFPGLEEAANELRKHPTPEGFTIKGHGRTSGRLFVPDLAFGEHIQMGENIFFFMGEMQECYVIYWLDAPVVAE